MYTLSTEQQASVEGWVASLPDSMVKANYEKLISEFNPKERVTSEQLEKFLSYANSLPKEFQNYPQEFSIWIKNGGLPNGSELVQAVEVKKETVKTKTKGKK